MKKQRHVFQMKEQDTSLRGKNLNEMELIGKEQQDKHLQIRGEDDRAS